MTASTCRACGAPMAEDALEAHLGIATCPACQAVYDRWGGAPSAPRGPDRPEPGRARPRVDLPAGVQVQPAFGRLHITWRWFSWMRVPLLLFAAFWDAILIVWYTVAFVAHGSLSEGDAALPALALFLVPLAHVAVGLGVTYAAIANLVNVTEVVVERGTLTLRHRPLPWYPRPTLHTADLEQLYCAKRVRRTKNGTTVRFDLRAISRAQGDVLLLGGLTEVDQALWIEQEIERHLGLTDRAVDGEHRPPPATG
jgi:hypothetical protein